MKNKSLFLSIIISLLCGNIVARAPQVEEGLSANQVEYVDKLAEELRKGMGERKRKQENQQKKTPKQRTLVLKDSVGFKQKLADSENDTDTDTTSQHIHDTEAQKLADQYNRTMIYKDMFDDADVLMNKEGGAKVLRSPKQKLQFAFDVIGAEKSSNIAIRDALGEFDLEPVQLHANDEQNIASSEKMEESIDTLFSQQFAKEIRGALNKNKSSLYVKQKAEALERVHQKLELAVKKYKDLAEEIEKVFFNSTNPSYPHKRLKELIESRNEIFKEVRTQIKRTKNGMISKDMNSMLDEMEDAFVLNINRAISKQLPEVDQSFFFDFKRFSIKIRRLAPYFDRDGNVEINKKTLQDAFEESLPVTQVQIRNVPVRTVSDNIENMVDFIQAGSKVMSNSADPRDNPKIEEFCKSLQGDKEFLKSMRAQYKDLQKMVKSSNPPTKFWKVQQDITTQRLSTMADFLQKPTLQGFKAVQAEMKLRDTILEIQTAFPDGKLTPEAKRELLKQAPKNMTSLVTKLINEWQVA